MKKKLSRFLLISIFSIPFIGCQTIQDNTRILGIGGDSKYDMSYVKANLKKGITTSEEVIRIFGKPNYQTSSGSGPDYFSYREGETKSNALLSSALSTIGYGNIGNTNQALQEGKQRQLSIYFKNNKVDDFSISE